MKRILKNCIERSLYDRAYKNSYESNASRPGYISKLVRRVAKKDPDGSHTEKRAKKDIKFCGRLALIVRVVWDRLNRTPPSWILHSISTMPKAMTGFSEFDITPSAGIIGTESLPKSMATSMTNICSSCMGYLRR
jgi:hypothetical protein